MEVIIGNAPLAGEICAPSSKSWLHRALICAALADTETKITYSGMCDDVAATIRCLQALGATITATKNTIFIAPMVRNAASKELRCGQSGATLRFLLPVAAALGQTAAFYGEGRLPQRPISPLCEQLAVHGCAVSSQGSIPLRLSGKLTAGTFRLAGNVSSQYLSGLLLALPLLVQSSSIELTGKPESAPYVELTLQLLARFGVRIHTTETGYEIPGGQQFHSPGSLQAQGDWSGAAFFLTAGALSPQGVCVKGLQPDSVQADRSIVRYLRQFGATVEERESAVFVHASVHRATQLDARDIPDLIPPLAALAAVSDGTTRIIHAERLRLKESDRLQTITQTLQALGAEVTQETDGLTICGKKQLHAQTVSGFGDHRIVMLAAIAATVCDAPVKITGVEAVNKSYPAFFKAFRKLNGEVKPI